MSIRPTSFLPGIVEELFKRYENHSKDNRGNIADLTIAQKANIYCELKAVFGNVLYRAIRLLGEQTITIYRSEKNRLQVVEITTGRTGNTAQVIKLFPNVNYCPCDNFAKDVLGLEPLINTATSARTSSVLVVGNIYKKYTCEHVLALHIAKILSPKSLRNEVLTEEKYNFLITQM